MQYRQVRKPYSMSSGTSDPHSPFKSVTYDATPSLEGQTQKIKTFRAGTDGEEDSEGPAGKEQMHLESLDGKQHSKAKTSSRARTSYYVPDDPDIALMNTFNNQASPFMRVYYDDDALGDYVVHFPQYGTQYSKLSSTQYDEPYSKSAQDDYWGDYNSRDKSDYGYSDKSGGYGSRKCTSGPCCDLYTGKFKYGDMCRFVYYIAAWISPLWLWVQGCKLWCRRLVHGRKQPCT